LATAWGGGFAEDLATSLAACLGSGFAAGLATGFAGGFATTARLPAVAAGRVFEATLADFVEVFFLLEVLMLGKDRLPC
jgi:hypothetical protein